MTAQHIPPRELLAMYASGIFPMAEHRHGPLHFYSPDPRAIIEPHDFHVPASLRKTMRAGRFAVRIDSCFEEVMRACAARRETWISDDIIASYTALHHLGYAHSVETWMDGKLAGGLYGVSLGGVFFGESMFFERRDASKIALVALVERMREREMELLDIQFTTPHLLRFGAKEIPRAEYLERLAVEVRRPVRFYP